MTDTSLPRRIAAQLTVRRLFPVALLLSLIDLFWTTAMHPWLPEQNPVAAALQAEVGWTGVGVVAVVVITGIFESYRRLSEPYGRIGATAVTVVLAAPALWNTSLYVRLDGWSTLWGPVFETTLAVGLAAAVAWLVYERETIRKFATVVPHPSGETVRALSLVLVLALSLPAVSLVPVPVVESDHDGTAIAQSTSSDVVFTGTSNGVVRAIDADTGDEVWSSSVHSATIKSISPSADGTVVYSASDDETVKALDAETGDTLWTSTVHSAPVFSVSASPTGDVVFTASQDTTVKAIDADTGDEVWSFSGHSDVVYAVSAGLDGDVVYTGSQDQTVRALDAETGNQIFNSTVPQDNVKTVKESPDGSVVYAGTSTARTLAIDTETGEEVWNYTGQKFDIRSVTTSPDGGTVYSAAASNDVRALDAATGDEIWGFTGHSDEVYGVAPSADGSVVFSGSGDNTLKALDAETGDEVWTSSVHSSTVRAVGTVGEYVGGGPAVSGTVTDQEGNPVGGATVELGNSGKTTTTASDGTYSIAPESTGQNTITADSGLDSGSELINVSSDGLTGVDFQLLAGDVGGQVVACEPTDPTCQSSTPVENATVEIVTIDHTEIENQFSSVNSAEEARQKAQEIEEQLEVDPQKLVPEEYTTEWQGLDPQAVEEKLTEQSGDLVVAAHDAGSWGGYEGTYINSKVLNGGPKPPQAQFDANERIYLSVWDPDADPQTTPDEQLGPGNLQTGDIDIEITELGPSADTATSSVNTPEFLTVREGVPGFRTVKTHEVAEWQAEPGIYALSPEGSQARTIIKVGSQDASDLYQGYVPPNEDEIKDRIDHFQNIADQFANYSTDNIVDTKRATTGAGGQWATDLPDAVKTVGLTAYKGSGNAINVTDLSTGLASQLIQAEQTGFNGTVIAPREPVRTDVPVSEPVTVRTTRLSSAPLSDALGPTNDELRDQFEDWLNETAPGLFEEFGLEPTTNFSKLQSQYEQMKQLAEASPDQQLDEALSEVSDDRLRSIVNDELDLPDAEQFEDAQQDREDLTRRINELETIIDVLREGDAQTEPPEVIIEPIDGSENTLGLSGEFPFPGEIEEVNARVAFADGTTQPIPENKYSIGSAGGVFADVPVVGSNAEKVVIDNYEVNASRPAPTLRVDAVVDNESVYTSSGDAENPRYEGTVPQLQAVDVSTLTPDPGQTVSVTPRQSDDQPRATLRNATVIRPDGTSTPATIEDGEIVFTPQSEGSHTVEFELVNDRGDIFVERASVNAINTLSGTPPTVRVRDGKPPITGNGIDAAELATNGGTVDLTAQAAPNQDIATLHVREADAFESSQFDLSVVQGASEQRIDGFVSVTIHDDVPDDALLWRNGDGGLFGAGQPIVQSGNEFGEVAGEGERIRSYTDDSGELTITVERDPNVVDRASHRVARFTAGLPVIGTIYLGEILVGLLAFILSLGGWLGRRRLRGVLPW